MASVYLKDQLFCLSTAEKINFPTGKHISFSIIPCAHVRRILFSYHLLLLLCICLIEINTFMVLKAFQHYMKILILYIILVCWRSGGGGGGVGESEKSKSFNKNFGTAAAAENGGRNKKRVECIHIEWDEKSMCREWKKNLSWIFSKTLVISRNTRRRNERKFHHVKHLRKIKWKKFHISAPAQKREDEKLFA